MSVLLLAVVMACGDPGVEKLPEPRCLEDDLAEAKAERDQLRVEVFDLRRRLSGDKIYFRLLQNRIRGLEARVEPLKKKNAELTEHLSEVLSLELRRARREGRAARYLRALEGAIRTLEEENP